LNFAISGLDTYSYHVFNISTHILSALLLFGIVRRTLLLPSLQKYFSPTAGLVMGAAVAILWGVHPIQTDAVTYIVQRTESLMGFFYLLTFYCFIRAVSGPPAGLWLFSSVIACALGMGCKESMATAPVLILLHDRTFVTQSFLKSLRSRSAYYVGL